jgi:transposase
MQEPADPQIIDGGLPAAGLVARTLISRIVNHLPYCRQETINARSGVHTPRSTLAAWSGRAGAALEPLYEAHKRFVLAARVLHADETPVAMLDAGAGKTKRGEHELAPLSSEQRLVRRHSDAKPLWAELYT